ncbi:uridine 5'-monophosphate synthase isoform X2 [Ceratina calcarata]|uniref:Orotidine 5'-phosphate decarboxylase n=1 Tax=Ceratina calcarata TaxID=156304 RepID=A0AAJ7S8C7_9HYME|nr:uridine 5'-monophosphate synthase isoform X2 [Ceratina calcarata]
MFKNSNAMENELKELAIALYEIDAVKFGEFVTKVGLKTPIYFDLRVIISHPKLMVRLAKTLWKQAEEASGITQICGVPYTALPLATLISADTNIPMLIKRKEVKSYGTKKLIEVTEQLRLKTPFHVRAGKARNAVSAKLLNLMEAKQSTICLAADLTKADEILELADLTGPHIVILKTHVDIIEDFSDDFIKRLKELAKKHDFLLMEDRKFADIGNTVSLQYQKGIYKIAEWTDLVTIHAIAGPSIVDGLKNSLKDINEPRGLFVVAEMSSKEALTTGEYAQNAVSIAQNSNLVSGLVCQSNIFTSLGLVQLTPGVKLSKSSDDLGQQYNTPESVVNSGADVAVVGRGITEAQDKLSATLEYKKELWSAYLKRLSDE